MSNPIATTRTWGILPERSNTQQARTFALVSKNFCTSKASTFVLALVCSIKGHAAWEEQYAAGASIDYIRSNVTKSA